MLCLLLSCHRALAEQWRLGCRICCGCCPKRRAFQTSQAYKDTKEALQRALAAHLLARVEHAVEQRVRLREVDRHKLLGQAVLDEPFRPRVRAVDDDGAHAELLAALEDEALAGIARRDEDDSGVTQDRAPQRLAFSVREADRGALRVSVHIMSVTVAPRSTERRSALPSTFAGPNAALCGSALGEVRLQCHAAHALLARCSDGTTRLCDAPQQVNTWRAASSRSTHRRSCQTCTRFLAPSHAVWSRGHGRRWSQTIMDLL
jgi:hypothetical protein